MAFPFSPLSVRILEDSEVEQVLTTLGVTRDSLPRCSVNDSIWRWVTPEGREVSAGRVVRFERDNQGGYPYTYRLLV